MTRTKKKETRFDSCDSAGYMLVLTHHELQTLLKILMKIKRRGRFSQRIYKKTVKLIGMSSVDHQFHLRQGTCILLKKNRKDEE